MEREGEVGKKSKNSRNFSRAEGHKLPIWGDLPSVSIKNWGRPTLRHTIVKHYNTGDTKKILQASRKKTHTTHKDRGLSLVFSTIILGGRWQWSRFFKIIMENYLQPRILHPAKPSYESRIKVSFDVKELKTFTFLHPFSRSNWQVFSIKKKVNF